VLRGITVSSTSTKWVSALGRGGVVGGRRAQLRPPDQLTSAVLLDAPTGLQARRADESGHVVLRWLPPPGAPMTTHIRYEVDVSAGNRAGGAQRVRHTVITHLPLKLLGPRPVISKPRPDGQQSPTLWPCPLQVGCGTPHPIAMNTRQLHGFRYIPLCRCFPRPPKPQLPLTP
jgi:hypothetical protein